MQLSLIQDDAVRRREEITWIRVRGANGIPKEVKLRKPRHRFLPKRFDILFEPFLQLFDHTLPPTNAPLQLRSEWLIKSVLGTLVNRHQSDASLSHFGTAY